MLSEKYKYKTTRLNQKAPVFKTIIFLIILISLILAFLLDLALGSVDIPLNEVVKILLGQEPEKVTWTHIILKFRLPKALTATLAGAALGVSGLQMQTLFKNPLAGPFVLGISSGASLGVALVVLTASATTPTLLADLGIISDFGLVIAASLGAASVLGMMLVVSRRVQDTMTLLILGLLFGYATSAIVSILLQFSSKEQIQSYINKWPWSSKQQSAWNINTGFNIQRYLPGQGFKIWHCERSGPVDTCVFRHLVFMTYLNDVTDGGETEWYHQQISIKPQKGLTVIWPVDWTFIHRGVPSSTQTKYIVTGWYSYKTEDFDKVVLTTEDKQ